MYPIMIMLMHGNPSVGHVESIFLPEKRELIKSWSTLAFEPTQNA